MLRAILLSLGAGFLALSAAGFASVTGVWPINGSFQVDNISSAAASQLKRTPLDSHSYFALGIAAEQAGKVRKAQDLIEVALQLDPRMRSARLWLLEQHVRTGQTERAILQAELLAKLTPRLRPALSVFMAELSRDPAARRLVAARLKDQPMILEVARSAAQSELGMEAVTELLGPSNLELLPNGISTAQSLVVEPLLKEGRFVEARKAWYSLGGYAPRGEVFDGDFEGLTGGPPFGWRLSNNTNVETVIVDQSEPKGKSALKVSAFGRLLVTAAEQTLTLRRGRHELRFASISPGSEVDDGDFAWTVSCRSGPVIAEALVQGHVSGWVVTRHAFAVPPNCLTQELKLTKRGTLRSDARTVRVTNVSVIPS